MSNIEARAKAAFEAYSAEVGGKTWDGKPIPTWEALTDQVRAGWVAAATAAVEYVTPSVSGMPGLTEGRMVHFVMPDGQHRPAIVVLVWHVSGACPGYVNLQVFTDGTNDLSSQGKLHPDDVDRIAFGIWWRTSVCYSEGKEPGTWHWIERA